ncbi:MAG: deoxyribonuclease V [Chloroflexi bacterium]|nr:deoxyribonuclease V [Chloroflexota bacterium]
MKLLSLHPWDISPSSALALQRQLAQQVIWSNQVPQRITLVAGLDISPTDAEGYATGAVVILTFPGLEVAEVATARERPPLPYIPGLLGFREVPVLAKALEQLQHVPDVLLVDGQGVAHPRRMGLACHIGLVADLPSIGCAKSALCGRHGPLGPEPGARAELVDKDEVVGAALRTRQGVTPIYVSIGHKVDLPTALEVVMGCCRGYRMPEPTRLAHHAAAGRLVGPALRSRVKPTSQPSLM